MTFEAMPITTSVLDQLASYRTEQLRESVKTGSAVERAYRLGILPQNLLYWSERGVAPDTEFAQRQWREHTLRCRILDRVRSEVERSLGDRIPFTVYRGTVLSERLFGRRDARDTGDVDIFVRRDDLSHGIGILRDDGFRLQGRPEPEVNNQVVLRDPRFDVLVEVHWAVARPHIPQPPVERFVGRDFGEEPSLMLASLCFEFHHHVGYLKGVIDIAACLDRFADQIDFDALLERARREGWEGILRWPVRVIEYLTHWASPFEGGPSLTVDLWAKSLAEHARGCLLRTGPVRGWDRISFKTTGLLRGHSMLWQASAGLLLDDPAAKINAVFEPVLQSPSIVAARHGKESPDLESWARWAGRPVMLVWKQWRDLQNDH